MRKRIQPWKNDQLSSSPIIIAKKETLGSSERLHPANQRTVKLWLGEEALSVLPVVKNMLPMPEVANTKVPDAKTSNFSMTGYTASENPARRTQLG